MAVKSTRRKNILIQLGCELTGESFYVVGTTCQQKSSLLPVYTSTKTGVMCSCGNSSQIVTFNSSVILGFGWSLFCSSSIAPGIHSYQNCVLCSCNVREVVPRELNWWTPQDWSPASWLHYTINSTQLFPVSGTHRCAVPIYRMSTATMA